MLKVFNDGIGLVIILPADAATPLLKEAMGTLEAWTIGTVLPREPQQPAVAIG